MNATYLTPEKIESLIQAAKTLRKGHTLNTAAPAPYLVIVDGQYIWCKTTAKLKKTLTECIIPPDLAPFRNAYKGATFNLDA